MTEESIKAAQPMEDERVTKCLHPTSEIDVVDLGIALWKRRKLMAAIFFGCTVGGFLLAFMFPPRNYNYSTTLSVGTYVKSDGSVAPYVSADTAATELNNGLIQTAIRQYSASHSAVDPNKIKITASAGSGSSILISGAAPKSLEGVYLSIEQHLPTLLAKSMLPRVKVIREGLRRALALDKASAPLGLLDSEQRQHSNVQMGKIVPMGDRVDAAQPVQIVSPPFRSLRRTGRLTRFAFISLGVVLGIIFALLAGACANYIAAIRFRLTAESE